MTDKTGYVARVNKAIRDEGRVGATILALIPEGFAHYEKCGDWTGLANLVGKTATPTGRMVRKIITAIKGPIIVNKATAPAGVVLNMDKLEHNQEAWDKLTALIGKKKSIHSADVKEVFDPKVEKDEKPAATKADKAEAPAAAEGEAPAAETDKPADVAPTVESAIAALLKSFPDAADLRRIAEALTAAADAKLQDVTPAETGTDLIAA